jgi:tetratricopeptide (TPR) repeat protein
MEYEYIKAIKSNPTNASLYNDYAVFLNRYRKDDIQAIKYLNRAIKFNPNNGVYKTNLNILLKKQTQKFETRENIFILFLTSVMIWIGYMGYTNIMNIMSLFILAQLVLNNKTTFSKNYN